MVIGIRLLDPELAGPLRSILPPGHVPADPAEAREVFTLGGGGDDTFSVTRGLETLIEGAALDAALDSLDAAIRQEIAAESPEMVFVHSGAVSYRGQGLLLPGESFAGKTELVVALLRRGAKYYSDEFAVLDDEGIVHPYPRPLSVRDRGTGAPRDVTAEELGARTGTAPVEPKLIAFTRFTAGAGWRPVELTPAAAALRLLAHTGQARREPERVLHAVHRAAERAVTLEGPRGEADPTAEALLERLGSGPSSQLP